ncbi:MAG: hypothetical protein ACRD3D_07765 [Terriglobia bacterium]
MKLVRRLAVTRAFDGSARGAAAPGLPARDDSFVLEPRTGGWTCLVRLQAGAVSLMGMVVAPVSSIRDAGDSWGEPALSLCWVSRFEPESGGIL